jgi:arabinose-5-phosphate isomerase
MQLALGDALAVALLNRRGFTAADFRVFHPGGRLGSKLRRVRELMHGGGEVPLAPPDMLMGEALVAMTARRFGCLGIVEADPPGEAGTAGSGRLIGMITDGDLRRALEPSGRAADGSLLRRTTAEIMTRAPRTIGPDALAAEALHLMAGRITALFVVDAGGRPIGILHLHDLLRAGVA